MAGRAHGQYTTTPSERPFGRRAGRPRRTTEHSLVFCSELVRRRRRGYVNRSARLSAREVGRNLLGRTCKNRIGPTRPTRVVYGPTDRHIPPRDRCMCPLAGAGRDVRACRSAGCCASRPARGALPMAPARTSWSAQARNCLGGRPPHGLEYSSDPAPLLPPESTWDIVQVLSTPHQLRTAGIFFNKK